MECPLLPFPLQKTLGAFDFKCMTLNVWQYFNHHKHFFFFFFCYDVTSSYKFGNSSFHVYVCRLWKEKCEEYDMFQSSLEIPDVEPSPKTSNSTSAVPYKQTFIYNQKLEMNWRSNPLRAAKYLKGHDDHVVTCLQFDGEKIVSASDDNTLKVWSAVTGNLIRTLVGHTGKKFQSILANRTVLQNAVSFFFRPISYSGYHTVLNLFNKFYSQYW